MGFVVLLLLSLTTFVRTESALAANSKERLRARANAVLAMQTALGNLQRAAGPDTRITTTASGRNGPGGNGASQPFWTGVWREATPADRGSDAALITWLVSGNDLPSPTNSGNPAFEPWTDPTQSLRVAPSPDTSSTGVLVPKIDISPGDSYAYWIRDEGVRGRVDRPKRRPANPDTPLRKRSRQSSLYQSGIGSLDGMSPVLEDPDYDAFIHRSDSTETFRIWADDLLDPAVIANQRHHWTFRSQGVQANAAYGGLKRDLSLAFELSEEDFNARAEFVDETIQLENLSYDVGYLFEEPANGGLLRGPTWQLLRDHYRTYKAIQDNGSAPRIQARAHYPNTREVYSSGDPNSLKRRMDERNLVNTYNEDADVFTLDSVDSYPFGNVPLIRPSRGQITPYLQRVLLFISFQRLPGSAPDSYHMAIVLDPVVVLWNPYNVALEVPGLKIRMRNFNVDYTIDVERGSSAPANAPIYDESLTYEMSEASRYNNQGSDTEADQSFLYFVATSDGTNSESQAPIRFEPGEMLIFSMTNNSPQPLNTNLYAAPGFNIQGGAYYERIAREEGAANDAPYQPLRFYSGDTVDIDLTLANRQFYFASYLVPQDRIEDTNRTWEFQHMFDPETQEVEVYPRWLVDDFEDMPSINTGASTKINAATLDFHINPLGNNDRSFPLLGSTAFTSPVQFERLSSRTQQAAFIGFWNARVDNTAGFIIPQGLQTTGPGQTGTTWGEAFASEGSGGQRFVPLLSVPTVPAKSLSTLAGANVPLSPYHPQEAIGNSLASPIIPADSLHARHNGRPYTQYDLSYLANEALWDDYFFSSIAPAPDASDGYQRTPAQDAEAMDEAIESFAEGTPPGNPRVVSNELSLPGTIERDLKADDGYRRSAAHLLVEGAFNVNATSVEAWQALLGMLPEQEQQFYDPFSESLQETGNEAANVLAPNDLPNGPDAQEWRGFRSLTDAQIRELAEALVEQTLVRGPFTSLADFINRALSTGETGLSGALQSAIDASGINDAPDFSVAETEISAQNQFPHTGHLREETGFSIPGNVTQADLLRRIGPLLSVRSDTFTIRAVGVVNDPLSGGEVTRAYCEAVVQRMPHYADATEDPWSDPQNSVNLAFGRQFEIVDFRWLDETDI